jgi:V/A-type H+/Na+-transporting ATPase subunit E
MSTDGVRKIIEEIEEKSEAKASEYLSEARKKAEEIVDVANQESSDKICEVVAKAEHEAKRNSQRILAEARIKARREITIVREELISLAFRKALDHLKTLTKEGVFKDISYKEVICKLLKESIMSCGSESIEVIVNENDTDLILSEIEKLSLEIEKEMGSKPLMKLSDETISVIGGVVLRSSDRKISVDNTFEARLERFKDKIRTEVAKELFEKDLNNE